MSGYKSFAVVGAGTIGKIIIDELLNYKAAGKISSVVVVSRSDAAASEWKSKGASFAIIDYDSPSTLTAAFAGVDVVISTVAGVALGKQIDLAKAAKSASVELFVPSEFGNPSDKVTEGFRLSKKILQGQLKELELPYSLFFTGGFIDYVFIPGLGFDLANGKVNIGGDGNTPVSFTHSQDIARYVAHVLTTLPTSKLEWKIFRIEGDRLTLNEFVSGYQKKTGKTLELSYTSRAALKGILASKPRDFLTGVRLSFDQGEAVVGTENDNALWPEWNPKNVFDVLASA